MKHDSPSAAYKPPHGGRTERSLMLSSSIVALLMFQQKWKRTLTRQRRYNNAPIRGNDRRIMHSGGGPC